MQMHKVLYIRVCKAPCQGRSAGKVILFSGIRCLECSGFSVQRRLWRETASLIEHETCAHPPSLPGPDSSNLPGSDSPGNLGERHSLCSGFLPDAGMTNTAGSC